MIFDVDIVWGQALARAKRFHSMCTQTAHTPIFVNFDENGRNFWEKTPPKCAFWVYILSALLGGQKANIGSISYFNLSF